MEIDGVVLIVTACIVLSIDDVPLGVIRRPYRTLRMLPVATNMQRQYH
jgi:hypothetical protein